MFVIDRFRIAVVPTVFFWGGGGGEGANAMLEWRHNEREIVLDIILQEDVVFCPP